MVIGVTGGIGCGKSKIIEIMKEKYNILNINTDNIAKYLMCSGNISYDLIVKHFGSSVLDEDKEIDRKKLSLIVLKNKDELLKLNSYTHPYVIKEVKDIIDKEKDNYNYIMLESALLIETELHKICDETWNIKADLNIRIDRLCNYRGYTKEEAINIINNQKSEKYYEENTSRTLINNTENDLKEILKIIIK